MSRQEIRLGCTAMPVAGLPAPLASIAVLRGTEASQAGRPPSRRPCARPCGRSSPMKGLDMEHARPSSRQAQLLPRRAELRAELRSVNDARPGHGVCDRLRLACERGRMPHNDVISSCDAVATRTRAPDSSGKNHELRPIDVLTRNLRDHVWMRCCAGLEWKSLCFISFQRRPICS